MSPSSKNKTNSEPVFKVDESPCATQLSLSEWNDLKALCLIHSTPGDEGEAARFMLDAWKNSGWKTSTLGRYAVLAKSPKWIEGRPTVLLCAHLDSPGFIVQKLIDEHTGIAISLGGPHLTRSHASALVKSGETFHKGKLESVHNSSLGLKYPKESDNYFIYAGKTLKRGDRICFMPQCSRFSNGLVKASFLDNRVGCWALLQVARKLKNEATNANVVLAATAQEEMTGFGADVLAGQIHADVTVCLDATYIDEEQGILFGGGPVLTVCDKSTLLCLEVCKSVEDVFARWHLPLQQEYYNYSGTDSRAFPKQANERPVLALLLATKGNHSPNETAFEKDILLYEKMCLDFCMDDVALQMIVDAWNSWGAVFVR